MNRGIKAAGIGVVLVLMAGFVGQAMAAPAKPLKVFILAGQSNMQGWISTKTFDSLADDPKTAPLLEDIREADGAPRVCEKVWISSIGCAGDDTTEQAGKLTAGFGARRDRIGPEYPFGIYMEKMLDEPILIIKTSWGGRSLHTDFRPPSAGRYEFCAAELLGRKNRGDDMEKARADVDKATGASYRLMIDHVKMVLADIKRVVPEYDPSQGYEIAGFLWFQGFNDLVSSWTYPDGQKPGGYDMYSDVLAHFIRDVRKDLNAPQMPFVIGVMGLNGPKVHHEDRYKGELNFHMAQAAPAALPEFKGNVVAVETAQYWDEDLDVLSQKKQRTPEEENRLKRGVSDQGYHYLGAAKIIVPIGKAFAEAMAGLQTTDTRSKQ